MKFFAVLLGVFLICACSKPIPPDSLVYDMIDVLSEPIQTTADDDTPKKQTIKNGEITITPVALYAISGVVVGTKKYSSGWESEICPIDVAIIWGELTKPNVRATIKYSQSNRWVYYQWSGECSVDQSYIESHCSNNHCIPINDKIKKALFQIKKEDHVVLVGELVRIAGTRKGNEIWWNSSTVRTDSGNGACEVMVVKRVRINEKVFEG